MGIRSIVVGTDGSEPSYRAFAMAVGLAVREQGCVHACFVSHVPGAAALGGFFAPVPLAGDADSDDRLARFVTQELSQASVRGDFTCRNGEIAAELEFLAEDRRADLIVVGVLPIRLSISVVFRANCSRGALPHPRRALSGPA